jgi:hypothetical protein
MIILSSAYYLATCVNLRGKIQRYMAYIKKEKIKDFIAQKIRNPIIIVVLGYFFIFVRPNTIVFFLIICKSKYESNMLMKNYFYFQ